jgi:hypothetical protein
VQSFKSSLIEDGKKFEEESNVLQNHPYDRELDDFVIDLNSIVDTLGPIEINKI